MGKRGGANLSNGSSEITDAFTDYSYASPDGAALLTFRITADNASDKIVVVDNFRLLGDARIAAVLAMAEPDTL